MCVNQSPPPSGSHSALKPTETTPSRPARDEMIIHTYHPQSTTWDGSKTQSMEVAQVAPAITKAWKLLFSKVAPGDTLRQGRNNQGPTNRKKKNSIRADKHPLSDRTMDHCQCADLLSSLVC